MRENIPVLVVGLHHPDVCRGEKGDFEPPPHPMNSRWEVDLPLLWSQDLCFRFKGVFAVEGHGDYLLLIYV